MAFSLLFPFLFSSSVLFLEHRADSVRQFADHESGIHFFLHVESFEYDER